MAKDLISRNIYKTILSLSIPIMMTFLLGHLYDLIDLIFLGRIGKNAVAIAGSFGILNLIIFQLMQVITKPVNHFITFAIGQNKFNETNNWFIRSFLLSIALGLTYFIILNIFDTQICYAIFKDSSIVPSAKKYLKILSFGFFIIPSSTMLISALRADGDSTTPLIINLLSNLLNIVLDYGLIFGNMGLPELGLNGAALATVISRSTAFLILFILFKRGIGNYKIKRVAMSDIFEKKKWHNFYILAKPCIGESFIRVISPALLLHITGFFGITALSAYSIGLRIAFFLMLPGSAINKSLEPLTGQNLGASKIKRTKKIIITAYLMYWIYAVPMVITVFFFTDEIIGLFIKNIEVISTARLYLRCLTAGILLTVLTSGSANILSASGDNVRPFIGSIFGNIILQICVAYFLSMYTPLKEKGIWIADPLAWLSQSSYFLYFLIKGKWKGGELFNFK